MAVAIRLTRVGATKRPAYRVIAIDKRRARDGRAIEILGYYDPLTEPATVQLETDKIRAWIGKGAQPSETVVKLMAQAERAAAAPSTEKPKRATRPSKPKASSKAAAKAAAKAEAASAEAPAAEEPAATTTESTAADATEGAAEPAEAAPDETVVEASSDAAADADAEKADA